MIIAIGTEDDPHIEKVAGILRDGGIRVARLDPSIDSSACLSISNGSSRFSIKKENYEADISETKAIWWRAKPPLGFLGRDSLDKSIIEFKYDEWYAFSKGLTRFIPDSKWINHIEKEYIASIKVCQLSAARSLDIRIPDTIISNDREKIKEFLEQHNKIIYKPLYAGFLVASAGVERMIYTTIITKDIFERIQDGISECPGIYQQYIEKQYELRITVVNNDIFPIIIYSQFNDNTSTDWRKSHYENKYEICDISDKLIDKIKKYMSHFKIAYGAFDFIYDKNNEYIFLECNPMGQWLWLENVTNVRISNSIAKNLAAMCK